MNMRKIINLVENTNLEEYLHGKCHILAIALHRLSGKPLGAMIDYDIDVEAEVLTHAYIIWQDDMIVDAKGLRNIHSILDDDFEVLNNIEYITISEKELVKLGGRFNKNELNSALVVAKEILNNYGKLSKLSNISEGIERVQIGSNPTFIVYKNPSQKQFDNIGSQVRMIIDRFGDLYAWDAHDATHDQIEEELYLNVETTLITLSKNNLTLCSGDKEDLNNKNLQRILGKSYIF